MNTKNNSRRRASVEKIEKAFVELLQNKELKEITVSEICQRCGLNRSTFYANYEDVYALADKIKDDLEKNVQHLYEDQWLRHINENDYLRLLRHMRQNQLFYLTYFKLGYDDQHQVQFYDVDRAHREFNDQHIDYHIEFFKNGFNAVVKMWLRGG